ncbi:MAG: class I mannose-6-phosphate isomerase [Bacteroidales bacterium]|nr:class I mannose-6-phosphate isomerase [Bacteroidales bacterium]
MEEKKLYPMRICSLLDEYGWGSEEFNMADLGYRDSPVRDGWLAGNLISEVMDTYMDRVVGDNVFESYGRQFPVCIRTLDCRGKMPLQVNPEDELAADRYDFLGKEKLWYVVSADRDALVYLGFRKDTDADELYRACNDGTVEGLLNAVAPHAGQIFHISPGTVHALSGKIRVLEIGESSPLDFCLYSWGQEVPEDEFDPALDLVEALDFIDYKAYKASSLTSLPQFSARFFNPSAPVAVSTGENGSFFLYHCLAGKMEIGFNDPVPGLKTVLEAGQTALVPEEVAEFTVSSPDKACRAVEVYVERREKADPYINPDADPEL